MSSTPMMQQYADAKAACGDALLLFRMGDFYELFYEDAKAAARALGLTLTSRDKGENPIPMAGFPYHQLESYLGKLITAGFRAAVCEQVEDPRKAVGLVRREVTRVVTAGTLTDDGLLDPKESNYLAAFIAGTAKRDESSDDVGLAWCDLSTGRFQAAVVNRAHLADHLGRVDPSECLLVEDAPAISFGAGDVLITRRPPWAFSWEGALSALTKHFGTANLEGFGFLDGDRLAIRAAGAVLDYLQETQRSSLAHIDRVVPYRAGSALEIDVATRRSLELTRTIRDGRREGSLLAILDRTATAMGSRLLADWLNNPLTDIDAINARLDAVEEFCGSATLRRELKQFLSGVFDLERLVARVTTGRANPRDLSFIGRTLDQLPQVKERLADRVCPLLIELNTRLDLCPDLRERLRSALLDECPLQTRDGGIIRDGYHDELDRLRELAAGGKQWIARYQAEEAARTGIPNLKVGYNKVFGYYIELTSSQIERAPADYMRKQTLKNAERYVTPQLKQYEEQVVTADERAKELEYELFIELRDAVMQAARPLQMAAFILAQLDVLIALADLARERNYCRPALVAEPMVRIRDGRHPVLDVLEPEGTFVPNDTFLSPEDGMLLLITGPNMAGKSTYIRQVALLALMAQMGSFIPAKEATIGIADRIFARVGASDELSRGQSTFMVEMTETARILNTASRHSLVILDEIGRGTSTYDGVSLAWAIVEHIHDMIACRTLFATHYHELTDLGGTLPNVRNLNVEVKEWEDHVVFLHKIVPGAADKSYGIHVARLAGIPREVNERAKQILAHLEAEHMDESGRPKLRSKKRERRGDLQLTLFAAHEHPLIDEIRKQNLDGLTPMQALQLIQRWQEGLTRKV